MVKLAALPNRKVKYKGFLLDIPDTLLIPTCDRCGAEWHNDDSAKDFDAAMEAALRSLRVHEP